MREIDRERLKEAVDSAKNFGASSDYFVKQLKVLVNLAEQYLDGRIVPKDVGAGTQATGGLNPCACGEPDCDGAGGIRYVCTEEERGV